jgi:mono/diheme cytochrome c family protein
MTRRLLSLILLAAGTVIPGRAFAAEDQTALPNRVRAVFAARCASCHGSDLARPKGKFGYVTDLKRLADSPKLVVPSKPDESRLWDLVESGEMPPPESPAPPPTAAEKELIRNWIAAGAPSEAPAPPPQQTVASSQTPAEEAPAPPSFSRRLLRWLGRFHILVIHFPIALLMAAAVAEAWRCWRRRWLPWSAVRFCVLLGAAGAVCAAALGWLHADVGGYGHSSPSLLTLHRWLGTTAAAWSLGVALLSEWDTHRGRRSWAFRAALVIGAALVGVTAHFGGGMVHGEDFFAW